MHNTDQTESKILHALREWQEQQEDQLPGFFRYYNELLHIQSDVQSTIVIERPSLTREQVQDNLNKGKVVLSFEDLTIDWQQVRKLFEQIITWSDKDSPGLPEENEKLLDIGSDVKLLRSIAEDWYNGCSPEGSAVKVVKDHKLLDSVLAITLKPFLEAYARSLSPLVDQEQWRRRHCPICGGKPDFAYLDKERGARWLICSRCDAEWLYLRLECPYCGNQQPNTLTYFASDPETNPYRIYVCDQCNFYIKAIDLRLTDDELFWPVERIKTLYLDVSAQGKGYKPG